MQCLESISVSVLLIYSERIVGIHLQKHKKKKERIVGIISPTLHSLKLDTEMICPKSCIVWERELG